MIFSIQLSSPVFPKPIELDSEYALFTALTVGHFAVVDAFVAGKDINTDSFFRCLSAYDFTFPPKPLAHLPELVHELCKQPPTESNSLDNCGRNFVFCYS
jgi:hypothetical protein